MRETRLVVFACVFLIAAVVVADAHAGGRPDSSSRNWFGYIDGGYTFATGTTSDFLDDDWTIGGGAMYWPSSWPAGIALDINYWRMDLSGQAIQDINDAIDSDPMNSGEITAGDFDNWQLGLNGIWSLGADDSSGFYLMGGVSWNSVTGTVTENGLVYYPPICDPWLWWCIPGGVGPGTFISGEQSSDEFGWNVGLGYSFPNTQGRGYVELRYQRIEFENDSIEYIPLTIGYRW